MLGASAECGSDISLYQHHLSLWLVHSNNISVSIDEKLLKVPFELASYAKTRIHLKILEDGVCIRSVDLALAHDGELSRVSIADELGNVGVALRLFGSELVAREANDLEALISELTVRLDQLFVVPVGIASCAGNVYYEDGLFALDYFSHCCCLAIDSSESDRL